MLGHYLASAIRNFRRRPLSTAIKLLALALGFGCCLTANLIADYVRRVDGQWARSDSIYTVSQAITPPGSGKETAPSLGAISAPAVDYLKIDFPDVIVAATNTLSVAIIADGIQQDYNVLAVDPEFFSIFDLELTSQSADPLTAPRSVLLEASAARQLFGTTDAAGRALQVGKMDMTVAAVFDFRGPTHLGAGAIGKNIRLIMPRAAIPDVMGFQFNYPPIWSTTCCTTYMLPPKGGAPFAEIEQRLQRFSETRVPPESGRVRFAPMRLSDMGRAYLNLGLFGGSLDLSLVTILNVFAVLILAVACVDFVNLAIAETVARAREIGVRKTMGATRTQVMAQMMLEIGLLSLVAFTLVVPLTLLVVNPLGRALRVEIDATGFLARPSYWLSALGVAALVCAATGAYPALVLARVRPVLSLRTTGTRGGAAAIRKVLIIVQFAAASFLLAAVAVMLLQRASIRERLADQSQDPRLVISVGQQRLGYDAQTLRTELLAHKSITGLTGSFSEPFRRSRYTGIAPETIAVSEDPEAERIPIQQRYVFYDYFDVAGIRLLAGRDFDSARDSPQSGPPPPIPASDDEAPFRPPLMHAIIDEKLAARLGFTAETAVGKLLYQPKQISIVDRSGGPSRSVSAVYALEIVGVVAATPLEYMADGPDSYLYVLQPYAVSTLILRVARSDVPGALAHIDATWRKFFPSRQIQRTFLDEAFDANFRMFNVLGMTFVGLSVIAVAIAGMGLFGIASFVVQRRAREIGVRKTYGATSLNVLLLVLWDFSKLVVVANAIAWPLAWLAGRTYLNLFVQRIDLTPTPFVFALGVSLLIAWVAVAAHVLRAAQINPAVVLKAE
jgi:putative ABC transport system permease protein